MELRHGWLYAVALPYAILRRYILKSYSNNLPNISKETINTTLSESIITKKNTEEIIKNINENEVLLNKNTKICSFNTFILFINLILLIVSLFN
jgi:hypothetical protein